MILVEFSTYAGTILTEAILNVVMATLALSQIISSTTHEADHTLDFIYCAGINLEDPEHVQLAPGADNFLLSV